MSVHPFLSEDFHIRWSTLTPEHIQKDIKKALLLAEQSLVSLRNQDKENLTYDNTFGALEAAGKELEAGWGRLNHLDSVANNEEQRSALNAMLPEVSSFYSSIHLDSEIWSTLNLYSQQPEVAELSPTKQRFIQETCLDFQHSGADLGEEEKSQLKRISSKLAALTQKFSENVLDSTNAYELILTDSSRLQGLPETAKESARLDALENKHGSDKQPQWRFTLQAPSMMPVMQHAADDSLRKEIWQASNTIGFSAPFDNTELVWEILTLRHEKAQILGHQNFADFVLQRRMAKNATTALNFIENLHQKIQTQYITEFEELRLYKQSKTNTSQQKLEPWETSYWAEQRRKEQYDFDDEELRPYFQVETVMNGMFHICSKLFGIRIQQQQHTCGNDDENTVQTWHKDCTFYELYDSSSDEHLGSFYADWHPRSNKRGGAWMNSLKTGTPPQENKPRQPHLGLIIGNMTKPVGEQPALLTHNEVETIFHEFGHLLHHLLSQVEVESLAGTNVPWDFVELPSQILENFCWERSSLDLFAKHYQTNEPIPEALFQKMLAARNYMSASAFMRQLAFGKLDLTLHSDFQQYEGKDLDEVDETILQGYKAPLATNSPSMTRRFGHLFSSPTGYAAGYYSYKWAEVLDADGFTKFQNAGVLNPEVGASFRHEILSRGNSRPVQESFHAFMGREPDLHPLLLRSGLT